MTEHRLTGVHIRRIAHATGQHDHHRRTVRIDGSLVAYWACRLAAGGPCPDLPPPAVRPRPEPRKAAVQIPPDAPARKRCAIPGHERSRRTGGSTYCLTCHRERERDRTARRREVAA